MTSELRNLVLDLPWAVGERRRDEAGNIAVKKQSGRLAVTAIVGVAVVALSPEPVRLVAGVLLAYILIFLCVRHA